MKQAESRKDHARRRLCEALPALIPIMRAYAAGKDPKEIEREFRERGETISAWQIRKRIRVIMRAL